MVFSGSFLNVSDNSGGTIVKCIKVYGPKKHQFGGIGDVILVSIRKYIPIQRQKTQINKKKKVIKSQIYKGVIVRVKHWTRRKGEIVSFGDNAVVLLKNENNFLFTRVFGPVGMELRKKGWSKILLLASMIV